VSEEVKYAILDTDFVSKANIIKKIVAFWLMKHLHFRDIISFAIRR